MKKLHINWKGLDTSINPAARRRIAAVGPTIIAFLLCCLFVAIDRSRSGGRRTGRSFDFDAQLGASLNEVADLFRLLDILQHVGGSRGIDADRLEILPGCSPSSMSEQERKLARIN